MGSRAWFNSFKSGFISAGIDDFIFALIRSRFRGLGFKLAILSAGGFLVLLQPTVGEILLHLADKEFGFTLGVIGFSF